MYVQIHSMWVKGVIKKKGSFTLMSKCPIGQWFSDAKIATAPDCCQLISKSCVSLEAFWTAIYDKKIFTLTVIS